MAKPIMKILIMVKISMNDVIMEILTMVKLTMSKYILLN